MLNLTFWRFICRRIKASCDFLYVSAVCGEGRFIWRLPECVLIWRTREAVRERYVSARDSPFPTRYLVGSCYMGSVDILPLGRIARSSRSWIGIMTESILMRARWHARPWVDELFRWGCRRFIRSTRMWHCAGASSRALKMRAYIKGGAGTQKGILSECSIT